jgi:hypothetical protein
LFHWNIIRIIKLQRIRSAGYIGRVGENRKSEGKDSLVRTGSGWEDAVKIRVKEIILKCMDCMCLVQDRGQRWVVAKTVMKLRVSWKCLSNAGQLLALKKDSVRFG